MPDYPADVLAAPAPRRAVREVVVVADLVVETADGRYCGAVVDVGPGLDDAGGRNTVTLQDRHGRQRVFPLHAAGFLLDGEPITLVRRGSAGQSRPRQRTASGSVAVPQTRARVARASRIWVEGVHDAALVERIWGDDLRVEGVVVEPVDGVDGLPARLRDFGPAPGRRVGVLVDHLVPHSKESRIAAAVRGPHVLVTGHPYVDIWQAVRPAALGIDGWPQVPRSVPWKDGVCAALGVADAREMWRRVLASVDGLPDVEIPLRRCVEELIDFVTA